MTPEEGPGDNQANRAVAIWYRASPGGRWFLRQLDLGENQQVDLMVPSDLLAEAAATGDEEPVLAWMAEHNKDFNYIHTLGEESAADA